MATAPNITLDDLGAVIDWLTGPDKLLLLDYLIDRADLTEELDTQQAAKTYAWARCETRDEADAVADDIIPQGSPHQSVWKQHAEKRDALLRSKLAQRERYTKLERAA